VTCGKLGGRGAHESVIDHVILSRAAPGGVVRFLLGHSLPNDSHRECEFCLRQEFSLFGVKYKDEGLENNKSR
jgi:hypothetical protein